MTKTKAFLFGTLGVLLFVMTTIFAGASYPHYDSSSQFISELYAIDAPNADFIRYVLYLPSGILFFLFSVFAIKETGKSTLGTLGFLGIGFGYGLGTVICSLFNCDEGCNPEFIKPSVSQVIHNLTGLFTYLTVPFSIILISIASRKWDNAAVYANLSVVSACICLSSFVVLNADLQSPYKGFVQRIIEGSILLWILASAVYIAKNKPHAPTQ